MTATVGDNSGVVDAKKLLAFVERIERMNTEADEIKADIKEIYAEAKGVGYHPKTIRKVVRLRAMNADKRREEEEMLQLYCAALGVE